jgi:transposase
MKRYPHWLDGEPACWYPSRCLNRIDRRRSPWHAAANQADAWSCPLRNVTRWNAGHGRRPSVPAWCAGGGSCSSWRLGTRTPTWLRRLASNARSCAHGPDGFWPSGWRASRTLLAAARRAIFPPAVAIHVVRLACERPDLLGRSLSQGDCAARARQLGADGLVAEISAATVRRILAAQQLTPWRHHLWRPPKHPREAALYAPVSALIELDTRPLRDDEMGLSLDEKTALQPRPRLAPRRPAPPQNRPNRYAHEDKRAGSLTLLAAFDTRSGRVYGRCYERTRQQEGIAFLASLDQEMAEHIRTIHLVCDNVRTQHGKEVTRWFAQHPRFVVHFTPVHGSWMNHVEQWFSLLQRKRLRIAEFTSKDHLHAKLEQFIREWNQQAHPCHWSTKSVAKVMAEAPALAV